MSEIIMLAGGKDHGRRIPRTSWRRDRGQRRVDSLVRLPPRPHNILDPLAFEELDACLAEIESEPSMTGLLVRSAKPAGFCAGADLKTIMARPSPNSKGIFAAV